MDWGRNRITVPSSKTDRYDGKGTRTIPLFQELRPFLEEAFELAEPGQAYVVAGDFLKRAQGRAAGGIATCGRCSRSW